MKNAKNLVVIAALIAAVAGVVVMKQRQNEDKPEGMPEAQGLPRMVDLGADKCIPCKMMAPILEELQQTHADKVSIEFIDVWKNEGAGQEYGVRVIPTQIFFDANGKELFRHEGFYSKEDILGKFKELGMVCDGNE